MTMLNPGFPVLQNYILLQGQQSPGVARIEGAGAPRSWDIRKGYGFSGATTVYTGDELSEFDVILTLWEPGHFDAWVAFSALLAKPPVGIRPSAMDIGHPILNGPPLFIKSVVVKNVSQFRKSPGMKFETTIKFLQYRAPKPMLGKPNQAIPALTPPTPTAQDKYDLEIQALQAKIAAEGG